LITAPSRLVDGAEVVRIAVGEDLKQNALDDGEHGEGGAEAECKGGDLFVDIVYAAAPESHGVLLGLGLHDGGDGADDLLPSIVVGGELFFAGGGDLVEAGALVALGELPLGAYPALALEAMKRGVERAGLDLEYFTGVRVEGLNNAVAVLRSPLEGLEDKHVEGSLDELDAVLVAGLACQR
jgi:hypothetical protein